jgi:FSR family fosmidomycin resistance protein-like MFS transporter
MTPELNRRGVALISSAHVINDTYQGVVPALLPFLVAQRHYSYAAVSGLTLAATLLSSVAQPFFGWWTDRRPRRWMIAAGMLTAATGVAAVGLVSSYLLTWVVIAVSGLGIAAFHPEAARVARQTAGNSNRAMSVFALGGNAGFALGSLVTAPVLLWAGLGGTVLLIVPALFMVAILMTRLTAILDRPGQRRAASSTKGVDDWRAFLLLTSVVVVRSVLFFGITSFLALYLIHELGSSPGVGNASLSVFLVAGGAGTLLGGWLADRYGRLTTIRLGFILMPPALAGLVLSTSLPIVLFFVVLTGIGTFIPFSVFVILSQDYLPNRIGTASGVTIGLAVSVGGLFNPLLGWLADSTSLRFTLSILVGLPLVALALSTFLREPAAPVPGPQPRPYPRLPDDEFV